MLDKLLEYFGILLTSSQKKYDLSDGEFHKAILAVLGKPLPITISGAGDSGENQNNYVVPVASRTKVVGVEITRPADTTAYAAKDVVGPAVTDIITFPAVAIENGAGGYIVKARLFTDKSDFTGAIRLHLFSVAPTAIADNAPFTLLYADAANRMGFIDFPAMATEGTGSTAAMAIVTPGSPVPGNVPLIFNCDANSQAIYGIAEILGAATPASGQKFFLEISLEQN